MEFSSQVVSFLITIATGVVLGVLFDCYRVLRSTFRANGRMTSLTDLLYWLVATVVVFLALVASNWGELRFYVFLGILSGVGLYYRLASVVVIRLFLAGVRFVKNVVLLIGKIIKSVVALLVAIIKSFVIRPVLFCIKVVSWPLRFANSRVRAWYHIRYPKPPKDEKV